MQVMTNGGSRRAPSKSVRPFSKARLLTRDEEQQLARQYRDGRDPAIARRLIESHLRLVMKIARQCCHRHDMLPDLVQEGCIGLIRALEKYDPDRNVRLSSYAAWWIRAFIYQYIMANARIMRVSTNSAQRKLFFNLKRQSERLDRDGNDAPASAIAEKLAVTEAAVIEMRARLAGRDIPFDTALVGSGGIDQQQVDGRSPPCRPDEMVERRHLRAAVARKLDQVAVNMDGRDRAILTDRLMAETPTTLRELGARFGIGRERARQLENRLKSRLIPLLCEFQEGGPRTDWSPPNGDGGICAIGRPMMAPGRGEGLARLWQSVPAT